MGGEFCCKKTHFSKIILPLLVILILTLVVNMTVTGVLQSTRAALRQIADNEASMDSSEIVKLANDTADSISGSLAKNGLISTMQLLMVVITTIIAFVCITNPLKKIIKQLNELTNRLENNQAGQLKIPSTNIGARQDDLFPVVFHKHEMHRLVQFLFALVTMESIPGCSFSYSLHSSSRGIVRKYRSRTNRDRPKYRAAQHPSRNICTTWETCSSPSQSLTASSPSWSWTERGRQNDFAAVPASTPTAPKNAHG